MRTPTTLLLFFFAFAPTFALQAKDHSYDIDRAQAAAINGEPTRAKAILKEVLRKDPADQAAKEALEALVHPKPTPTRTATPTAMPTPKPKPVAPPKPVKAKPAKAVQAPAAPAKKAAKAESTPQPQAKPAAPAKPAPDAMATPIEPPKATLLSRIKAKFGGFFHRQPAAPTPLTPTAKPEAKAPVPCAKITFVYFGNTRTGTLLEDLPKTKEVVVTYNKGKLKVSRDQVIKTEACGKA